MKIIIFGTNLFAIDTNRATLKIIQLYKIFLKYRHTSEKYKLSCYLKLPKNIFIIFMILPFVLPRVDLDWLRADL